MPVIDELDEKKSDPRLSGRASAAIKDIEEFTSDNDPRPVRDNVDLEICSLSIRASEFPETLDPASQDDRIVHLVKKYISLYPERNVCVLTADLGMVVRCRVNGVPVRKMDKAHQLENPGDEKDKKLKQALAEAADLKNKVPKLAIYAVPVGQEPTGESRFQYELSDTWVDLDVEAQVDRIRRTHLRQPAQNLILGAFATRQLIQSHMDWGKYDNDFQSYVQAYELYIGKVNTWGRNAARTVHFDLWLSNDGNTPATDIGVQLTFPECVAFVAESNSDEHKFLEKPQPAGPQAILAGLMKDFSASTSPFASSISSRIDSIKSWNPHDAQITMLPRSGNGYSANISLTRMKHGQNRMLGTFSVLFRNWSDVSAFSLEYAISATEIPKRIDGNTIPMIIKKK